TPKGLSALIPQPSKKDTAKLETIAKTIVVQVFDTGKVKINEEDATWDSLGERLSNVFKQRAEKVAFVQGEDGVRFFDVARAIDIMRSSGIEKVGFNDCKARICTLGQSASGADSANGTSQAPGSEPNLRYEDIRGLGNSHSSTADSRN